MQASQRVKPVLEQAAAAAAAFTDAAGVARAESAAKKAKKLTPAEMKLMRQQADPNFASKKDAPAAKKAKGSKAVKAAAAAAVKDAPGSDGIAGAQQVSATSQATAGKQMVSGQNRGDKVNQAAAAASASGEDGQGKPSAGSKRHHGLGFVEEQPTAKRAKQPDGTAVEALGKGDSAAVDNAASQQHPADQQPGEVTAAQVQRQQQAQGSQQGQQGSQQGQGMQKAGQGSHKAGQGSQQAEQASAAAGKEQPNQAPVVFTDECTAFVRGLDSKVTEAELQTLLAPCGDIKDVRIVLDKATHRPKVSSTAKTVSCASGTVTLLLMCVTQHTSHMIVYIT